MKKTRLLSLLLVALLASQTLVSCGGTSSSGSDTTTGDTTPAETEPEYLDNLGDLRFDGEEFTLFLAHGTGEDAHNTYIMEEETGDVLDDAVFARNRKVEESLGITLTYVDGGYSTDGTSQAQATAAIQQYIMAGDDTYDAYIHVQHTGMPGMIAEGNFVDWNTIPNLDLTKEYWYQLCIEDINYGDKIYAMTGAYHLNSLTAANVLYFNKRLFDELQEDYPYQMVLDGTWTFDKFYELVEKGTLDLNGDTNIEFGVDQVGYWGWGYEQYPGMFISLGGDVCLKDEKTGMPVLNIDNERTVRLIDSMKKLFELPGANAEWSTYGIFNTAFESGQVLFLHAGLSFATNLREMEDDFGFVPYPKLDEDQATFKSRVQNTSCLTYIPVTNSDLAFTGAVLERMASVSQQTTIPAFFDTVLTIKSTRDTESEQMISIIQASCSFYDEAAGGFSVNSAVNSSGLASYWAGVKAKVEENVQKNIIDVYFD